MRKLAKELHEAERRFTRDLRDRSEPPKEMLLDLQRRLDQLRQGIWEARKLCDPYLVGSKPEFAAESAATLAERILNLVDSRKRTA